MPGNENTRVICPFFRRTSPGRIVCEGLYPGSCIQQGFERAACRTEHLQRYCESESYRCCEIYQAVVAACYQKETEEL